MSATQALNNSCLRSLSDFCIEKLSNTLTRNEIEKGEILIQEDSNQDKAFLIESGEISCLKNLPESNELVKVDSLREGGISGFFHIFENDPTYCTLQITSPKAIVWTITREQFKILLKEEEFFSGWLSFTCKEIRTQSKVIRALKPKETKSSKTRVAFFDSSA